jgi:hypothetical protein
MYKLQIFQDTLNAVSEETEVEIEKILSGCKEEEVIDARVLLIKLMHDKGLYPNQISTLSGICSRSVNRFLLDFYTRISSRKMMRINYDKLKNNLGI